MGVVQKPRAALGLLHALRVAREQRNAQTGLHLTHVMAERRLGDAKLQRRFGEAAFLRDRYEVAQLAQVIIHV